MGIKNITLIASLLLIVGLVKDTEASTLLVAGDPAIGREYNDVLKKWIPRKVSIVVGSSDATEPVPAIYIWADTALKKATSAPKFDNHGDLDKNLASHFNKALEWSDVAKKNKADISKKIWCWVSLKSVFSPDGQLIELDEAPCNVNGVAVNEGEVGFLFFSSQEGKQTNLVLSIIDYGNRFIKATIYLDPPEIKKLLAATKQIKAKFKEVQKREKQKKELFK